MIMEIPPPPQPFEVQYDALLDVYYSVNVHVDETPTEQRSQRLLEVQSQLAELCGSYGEWRRALGHYETILKWVTDHLDVPSDGGAEILSTEGPSPQEQIPETLQLMLPDLEICTYTNMATICHRSGDLQSAMTHILRAKKLLRERQEVTEATTSLQRLEFAVTVNYAVLLKTQGALDDAIVAAEAVQSLRELEQEEDETIWVARLLTTDVLCSSQRSKSETQDLSTKVRDLLYMMPPGTDPHILARAHNNVGLDLYAKHDFSTALEHFLSASRVLLTTCRPDTALLATVRYHIGRTLAELGTTTTLPDATEPMAALQYLTLDDNSDPIVQVVAQASLGELAYYNGDFTSAHTQLTSALDALEQLRTNQPIQQASHDEFIKIQGFIESLLGNALLSDGLTEEAEAAHQRDLELALESEDIHAQLRALRNLAVLYDATQRYAEAATLWHETIEIATVLTSKHDLMVAYGGLGATLQALRVVDDGKHEYHDLLAEHGNQPRVIFIKQRTLAAEMGDLESQVRAQRSLVGTYEWQPQPTELERRLEECDAFVQLSEQLGQGNFRADAYRSLANALTAQLKRLAERGHRFADAILVLTAKRQTVLQKFREAASQATTHNQRQRPSFRHVDVVKR